MGHGFTDQQVAEYERHFKVFDLNGDGRIDMDELTKAFKNLGEFQSMDKMKDAVAAVDQNGDGYIDFQEFLLVMAQVDGGSGQSKFAQVYEKAKSLFQVKGFSGVHSFSQEEMTAFSEHLNYLFADDADLAHILPIATDGTDLCKAVRDGILLAKLINAACKNTIDFRAVNRPKKGKVLSIFQINENQNLAISAAKSIGIQVTNIGSSELITGEQYPHIILGLVWQLVKMQLLSAIDITFCPELVRLLEEDEDVSTLKKMDPKQLLLRWFNFHLAAAEVERRVTNFGPDVKDSYAYTILLNQISHGKCSKDALNSDDLQKRAEAVVDNATQVGAHAFIKPSDIVKGNRRLNMGFAAAIFNACHGLEELTEEEQERWKLNEVQDESSEGSREQRAFRMWMNSLGIEDVFTRDLLEDCGDGMLLLKVIDKIEPGLVDWKKAEKKVNNRFKKIANSNYVVDLGKKLGFSLVGIGGVDIVDGNEKLVLGFVWQLMRFHTIKFLSALQKGGRSIDEKQIIAWSNKKVAGSARTDSPPQISSLKDKKIGELQFVAELLFAIDDRVIDWEIVTPTDDTEERVSLARYLMTAARKLGATIFCLPEDIVECKPKMVLTFLAAIMTVGKTLEATNATKENKSSLMAELATQN